VTSRRTSTKASLVELVSVLAVAIGLAILVQAYLVKPFQIPSESMVPTLTIGQRVLVNRVGTHFGPPAVGDVVVFHPPAAATGDQQGMGPDALCGIVPQAGEPCGRPTSQASAQNFVKRVVGGPGDTIAVVGDHVVRNGRRQREPFVQAKCDGGIGADFPTPVRIPRDHWFMMGDNRECSQDSRYWGPVPTSWVVGQAFATYWPPQRVGGV
jgi:signal peptidase I